MSALAILFLIAVGLLVIAGLLALHELIFHWNWKP